jgi:hypothetical protein
MNGGAVEIVYGGFSSKMASAVTTKYLVEDDVNPTGYPQLFDQLTGSTVTHACMYGLQRISENQVIDNVWTRTTQVEDADGLTDDKLRARWHAARKSESAIRSNT